MIRGIESVNVFSQNARRLASFYKDKVGLKLTIEAAMGRRAKVFGFEFPGTSSLLYIADSDMIKGAAKGARRVFINFEVDEIEKEVRKLAKNKVKTVQEIYHLEGYGWVATFEDLDGNYFQLVQVRAYTPKKKAGKK